MPGSEEFCREEVLRNTPMNNQNSTDSFAYDTDDYYRKFCKKTIFSTNKTFTIGSDPLWKLFICKTTALPS